MPTDTDKLRKTRTKNADRKRALADKLAKDAKLPKTGRPTSFDEATKEEILRRPEDGETMTAICRDAWLPERWSVYRYARTDEAFSAALSRARQSWALVKADEILEIAYDDRNDWEITKFGGKEQLRVNREAVDRSKLKIGALQWMMARMNPRIFSDDATKLGPDSASAAEIIKSDATIMQPDEPGPAHPVL